MNASTRQSMLDVSVRSSETDHSAFVMAAHLGCADMLRLMLGVGVQADTRDVGGWTALHAAANAGHGDVAHLLLEAGVSDLHESGDLSRAT